MKSLGDFKKYSIVLAASIFLNVQYCVGEITECKKVLNMLCSNMKTW